MPRINLGELAVEDRGYFAGHAGAEEEWAKGAIDTQPLPSRPSSDIGEVAVQAVLPFELASRKEI